MKPNYSRLLLALVSSASMATTAGLSAQSSPAMQPEAQCKTYRDMIKASTLTEFVAPTDRVMCKTPQDIIEFNKPTQLDYLPRGN